VRRPELVRSLVVAEPPVLRWLLDVPGGKEAFDDFMARGWKAAGTAFREGERERGVGAFIDYFIGAGSFARFPAHMRERIMEDSRDFEALTTSSDAFPPLPREAVAALDQPVLMLSGGRTPRMHALLDAELEHILRHVERRTFPDAGHDLWIEAYDEVQAAALDFLLRQTTQ
jgi:pimeloyl-ACP methyl ester carboxylesterase